VLHDAQARNAERLAEAFHHQGASDVVIATERRANRSLGAVLREIAGSSAVAGRQAGLIVLGAGSVPVATGRDLRRFVEVAGSGARRALANNRYSADIVAIGRPSALANVPDIGADNVLPRWLDTVGGFDVEDLASRWRLAIDLDSPLDVLLTKRPIDPAVDTGVVGERLASVRSVARDPRAELIVAGRTSAATLRWLERSTASRTRALIEERGLRASAPVTDSRRAAANRARPAASALGLVLEDRGPEALGLVLGRLGDAALIDSRVLLAHRLGADERAWPSAEDRFASDLLLPDRIVDPWLRALTASARDAAIPIVLGGHTLVGPGVRLALGRGR